jgi:hypothetical protein
MTPNRYTELFFLDEATALAAGHRPCAECRHSHFLAFCEAWKRAHPEGGRLGRPAADEIDNQLHAERVGAARSKRSFVASLSGLPDGVFVTLVSSAEEAYLVQGDCLLEWFPAGYGQRRLRPRNEPVRVLTPKSTVAAIQAGYVPEIHASVCELLPRP